MTNDPNRKDWPASVFVHPTAVVDPSARLGEGTRIWHFTHVMAGAVLGRGVVLGQNSFVAKGVEVGDESRIQNNVSLYEGVVLGAGVFVGPSVVFTNVRRPRARFPRKEAFETTRVEDGASLGANTTIVCGVVIGRCAFVGAGSVVTKDVPAYGLVFGNPATLRGYVCECGEKISSFRRSQEGSWGCKSCGRFYILDAGHVQPVDRPISAPAPMEPNGTDTLY